MRLKKEVVDVIKSTAKIFFGDNAKVYLFGSRVDDFKKGGDIDLYIETDSQSDIFSKKLKMLAILMEKLGEQKIDIVINDFSKNVSIYKIAKREGIPL